MAMLWAKLRKWLEDHSTIVQTVTAIVCAVPVLWGGDNVDFAITTTAATTNFTRSNQCYLRHNNYRIRQQRGCW